MPLSLDHVRRTLTARVRFLCSGNLPGPDVLVSYGPAELHRLMDDAASALRHHYYAELAVFVGEVCSQRGLPAPVLTRFTATDDEVPEWFPNGVRLTFTDATERSLDFGDRRPEDRMAVQLLRAYLAEVSELDRPRADDVLELTLWPTVGADIVPAADPAPWAPYTPEQLAELDATEPDGDAGLDIDGHDPECLGIHHGVEGYQDCDGKAI